MSGKPCGITSKQCRKCETTYKPGKGCPGCQRIRYQKWIAEHPNRPAEYNRKYNQKVNGKPQREYEQRNKTEQSARRLQWKRENFAKVREYAMRRYAWQIASGEKVDYDAILTKHGMTCHLCGDAIANKADLHFDHVIPLSRGGLHTADNLRPSHAFCNWSKNDRLPGEYKARRKR